MASLQFRFFSTITFLFTSLIIGGWLIYLHKVAKESSLGLKEILYVVLFLTVFTTIWSGFNVCVENNICIHQD